MSETKTNGSTELAAKAIDVQPYLAARKAHVDEMHDQIEKACDEMIAGLEAVKRASVKLRGKEHDHIETTTGELLPMADVINGASEHGRKIGSVVIDRAKRLAAIEAAIAPPRNNGSAAAASVGAEMLGQ